MAKHQITKSFWADPDSRRAEMRLEMPFGLVNPQPAISNPQSAQVSQFYHEGTVNVGGGADADVSSLPVNEIVPRPEDLIYFNFRAISQRVVECYSVDYTRPGVLEASTSMLVNQRVCKDHRNRKAEDAIGRIVQATWDAVGKDNDGLPGINIRFFVDAKIEPRLVRLLSYGGVHSGSVTVAFEWEPSHPELLKAGNFWWKLGEEVDNEIVRLIATKILYYEEFSTVFEGADSAAKRIGDDAMPEVNDDGQATAAQTKPQGETTTEGTMKLKQEHKTFLGLQHAAEDVPESDVLAAIERMQAGHADTTARLAAADAIISAERAEVVRLATLAEGVDGVLNSALAGIIQAAAPAQLPELKKMYEAKAAAIFGNGRSSVESNPVTQKAQAAAEQAKSKTAPRIPHLA